MFFFEEKGKGTANAFQRKRVLQITKIKTKINQQAAGS
jgi:hypothetical protein